MADLIVAQRFQRPPAPGLLYGPDNRTLVRPEMLGLVALYWPAEEIQHAVSIAWCESGFQTGAWAYLGEDSRGLFQINVEAHPQWLLFNLFDPQVNCYYASQLWSVQGWHPWSCARKLGLL